MRSSRKKACFAGPTRSRLSQRHALSQRLGNWMKRFLLCAMGLALLVGCQPKDRATIVTESSKAWEHASKAAITAWNSVAAKVSEITPDASKEALAAARSAVDAAKKKLESVPNPTPEIRKKIEEARAGISKIDAAATLKELQDKSSAMLESARQRAENTNKTLEEVRTNLEAGNEQYKALQLRINEAKEGYRRASEALKEAVQNP